MKRKTHEEFLREVADKVGGEYSVLSKYMISRGKIKVKHNHCGYTYSVEANNFLQGGRCPQCHGNKATQKTTDSFTKEVWNLVGDEYDILGEYVNRSTNVAVRHSTCGREYNVEPGNFLYGSRCVECYHDSLRLSQEVVDGKVIEHLGAEYKTVSEYRGSQDKIKVRHSRCEETFDVRYNDIVQHRSGCPHCNQSRGEQDVANYLKSKQIEYEFEKKFDDLRHIFQLSYDFYLPEYGIVIEFQGEQHYRPKNFGNETPEVAESNFHKQLEREMELRESTQRKITIYS